LAAICHDSDSSSRIRTAEAELKTKCKPFKTSQKRVCIGKSPDIMLYFFKKRTDALNAKLQYEPQQEK
jgi:hypothetical protein